MTKAPLGGGATGPNPTDRAKSGTKRSQLCEGHGLPLAVTGEGANVHETRLAAPTLDAIVIALCWLRAVSVGQMRPLRTPHDISRALPIPQSTCKIERIHLLLFTKG